MAHTRVLVVDDEPIARRGVVRVLEAAPGVVVVGEAGDGESALHAMQTLRPDVVFLDVQMPERNGLEALAALDADAQPQVVFVTAYDQHAVEAFDLHAVDYVLKPFDDERLLTALARVRARLDNDAPDHIRSQLQAVVRTLNPVPARIPVRSGPRVYWVEPLAVDWIDASGNYAVLHEGGRKHLVRETLSSLEGRLASTGFVRIHRSALVNMDRVRELRSLQSGDAMLKLADGTEIRMSRSYRQSFEARMAGRGE